MSDAAARQPRLRTVSLLLCVAVAGLTALAVSGEARSDTRLSGIDVSNWQHQIDWLGVSGTGVTFVFAKAAEGTNFTDLTFAINRAGAKGIGIRFGAYHYARPSGTSDAAAVASARAQADHFLSVAQPVQGELLPALDMEETGGLSVARLTLWTQTWLNEIVARTGLKPIVYVSPSFWKSRLGDSPVAAAGGNQLWIAHWTSAALPILPGASWGGLGWSFWQWSNCQRIAGITGCVDGDRYNGPSLAPATVPAYAAGAATRVTAPSIVGEPVAGKLLAVAPGTWSGGKPIAFTYQWQSCDAAGKTCAAIAGATAATYTPAATDVGHPLVVRVSAASTGGTATAVSAATLAVASSAAGTPVATAPKVRTVPTIAGLAQAGQVLTAQKGTWTGTPTSYTYQWRRCVPGAAATTACTAIAGAGAAGYTISPGDIGATLSLTVTAIGKGGAGSATSASTATVAAAPVPAPSLEMSTALAGQAGAVTTQSNVAVATWQPGALPDQASVSLVDTPSKLALAATSVKLAFGATAPLPWPIDIAYPAAPDGTVPGILPLAGVWQPLAELPTPTLPESQQAGTYRDVNGALHVLSRTPGRIALFSGGKWGDPRYATALKPRVTVVATPTVKVAADGSATLLTRITLDTQAHLYVSLSGGKGATLLLPQKGARIGWWLQGTPAKTLQALQLRPGALPLRLQIPAAQLRRGKPTSLRIAALDPYGRRSVLTVKLG